ncbi:MAG: DUF488 family protein [Gammaproteobacteria bacterium]|nr:DUF488 family protein [Gammaproteobacteria bacterium]
MIKTKRIYDPPHVTDGTRVLIDRLWPRGLSKERAAVHIWARELAPSTELRRWYAHEPSRWNGFKDRYFAELDANAPALDALRARLTAATVTLLFGSKELQLNNAAAFKIYLESHRQSGP